MPIVTSMFMFFMTRLLRSIDLGAGRRYSECRSCKRPESNVEAPWCSKHTRTPGKRDDRVDRVCHRSRTGTLPRNARIRRSSASPLSGCQSLGAGSQDLRREPSAVLLEDLYGREELLGGCAHRVRPWPDEPCRAPSQARTFARKAVDIDLGRLR